MAVCLEKTGEAEKHHAFLEKLEKNALYDPYNKKAIRLLADEDFFKGRFVLARTRYQKYLESEEKDNEIEKKVEWINYHEKDDFYPLILFVQASQKGLEYYYGLKIILEDYPESPLAFPACQMYLQSQNLQSQGRMVSFPETKTMDSLVSYLEVASESYEFQEIAFFIIYWKAYLLEQSGKQNLALKLYKKIQEEPSYARVSNLAREAIYRMEKNYTKQRKEL